MLQHQTNRSLADFRGVFRRCLHGSILSRVGASGKAGAVQNFLVGLALFVTGGFVMYTENDEVLEVVRAVKTDSNTASATANAANA